MARKIAGGFGKQAAFALALACLSRRRNSRTPCFVLVGVQYTVRLARDANYVA
jgi:hypothetical protein